ncbi:hypothetical protein MRB53_022637 [Persea americana]|uniref:Uncharacterized protein n=1 Tax=Persea americana TaxID=3435 RepID=A0ACC2L7A6_PERAE|nr:hypothetical protein MRB53_022637 [Persea americana]
MGGGGGRGVGAVQARPKELDETPTWAVAAVVAIIIVISIGLEKILHRIGEWFNAKNKRALYEALEKVKAELMILGFISLLLTFGQSYIARICISEKLSETMLPCALIKENEEHGEITPPAKNDHPSAEENHHQRLLWDDYFTNLSVHRRVLSGHVAVHCKEGKVPLVSTNALHQLHIFIFFLAVFHVLYSALTMALGRLKIRGWKEWETETASSEYDTTNDPSRFRFAHETSFVRLHTSIWTKIPLSFYVLSFFRQFFRSVGKADYLTMRHGFIAVHLSPGTKFNFQKYIKRSLEDDFKVIVGISPVLWATLVVFLLLNVHGWQAMFWLSIVPLVIILAVGTKLQGIIMEMALEIRERHAVVQGIPLVQIGDKHFWFGRPKLVLHLIHFTLFQNAFEIIYFFWIWYEFGLRSCFHENFELIIARVALGVGAQFLCSYITLPLYALVSQMGSHMKKSIFDEHTSKAIKKWHLNVKKKPGKSPRAATKTLGGSPGGSPTESPPASTLQQSKSTLSKLKGRSGKHFFTDPDTSEADGGASPTSQTAILIATVENPEDGPRKQEHD